MTEIAPPAVRAGSFIASSALLTGSRVVGVAIQALTILLLARALPIEDLGWFGLVYAGLGIVRYLGPLGTDVGALRRIARDGSTDPRAAQTASFGSLIIASGVATAAALLACVALVAHGYELSQADNVAIIAAIPAFALIGAFAGQIRGFGKNIAAQVPEAIGLHALLGGAVLVLYSSGPLALEQVLVALCVASWAVVGLYALVRLRIGLDWSARPSLAELIVLAREGLAVSQALAMTAFSARLPLLLAAILVSPAGVALLDIASRFGRLPEITTASVSMTSSARFAREASGDRAATLRTLQLSSAVAAVPAILWVVAVASLGSFAIAVLLPPDYVAAYVPMLLIALAVAINAALGQASTLMLMSGRESLVRFFSFLQFGAVAVASLALAPTYGVNGIAMAVVFGSLVRDGGMMSTVILSDAATRSSRQLG